MNISCLFYTLNIVTSWSRLRKTTQYELKQTQQSYKYMYSFYKWN